MTLKATEVVDPAAAVLPPGQAEGGAASAWPWMALGGVLLLLFVIARFARKRLPFGRHP